MKHFVLTLALSCLFISLSTNAVEENLDAKLTVYRTIIAELGSTLGKELMTAMKAGGAVNALEVCNTKAQQITADFSKKAGLTITRISHKPRNANDAPLAWQTLVLQEFEKRKATGENLKQIESHSVVEVDGKRQSRYMKAIFVKAKCLACHGDNIAPALQAKITQLYPNDQATGFKVGDLRGAVSVVETLK